MWDKRGCIYKNGDLRRGNSLASRLWSTFYYELGHAGIRRGKTAIKWCGGLSYRKIRRVKVKAEEIRPNCPSCDRVLYRLRRLEHGNGAYITAEFYGEMVEFEVRDWTDKVVGRADAQKKLSSWS
jgi:hypothetical protein